MYAAAGGASLASRQARQRQRQNKKAAATKTSKATGLEPRPPQKGQFYNYTDETMPPLQQARLSRVERNALRLPQPHERRHSTSNYHLKEPRARIRESPSICIPVQNHLGGEKDQPLTPCTLVHPRSPSPTGKDSLLPQILIPEGGDKSLERRCSFVRQVEEMERCPDGGKGVLDRCNHMCNFEIKDKGWDGGGGHGMYGECDRSLYGSLEYPFSECSQGRAAWQERERGRRCSLSEEARQHRLKQSEAHHRWMKRNRIHDTTYGGSSEEEDFFDVYHQSAAANALLYVGLGTSAIGSVIFFVGTGEKGFKTLELRLIGPTLIACGLLCCLIRVLLCACPSNCFRRRKKTRLKNVCPHGSSSVAGSSSRYPLTAAGAAAVHHHHPHRKRTAEHHHHHHHHHEHQEHHESQATMVRSQSQTQSSRHQSQTHLGGAGGKKKVSIVTGASAMPSTSTQDFQEERICLMQVEHHQQPRESLQQQQQQQQQLIPIITVPASSEEDEEGGADGDDAHRAGPRFARPHQQRRHRRRSSSSTSLVIELDATLEDAVFELDAEGAEEDDEEEDDDRQTVVEVVRESKHHRNREPALATVHRGRDEPQPQPQQQQQQHSGIVLSPLQLQGQ